MARLFDSGSSENLAVGSAVISGHPFAFVSWFRVTNITADHAIVSIADVDAAFYFGLLAAGDDAGDFLKARAYDGGADYDAESSIAYTANTWQHGCAIFVSTTDRRVFLNGGSKGTNVQNHDVENLDRTTIGVSADTSPAGYCDGDIAETAIYDLSAWPGATDSDKADAFERILPSLAKGFSPLFWLLGLKAYWPLIRGLNDKTGGYNMTANGSVISTHPRVILPHGVM